MLKVDQIFEDEDGVSYFREPFLCDFVFPEPPKFFAGDTPELLAKEITAKCVDEWYAGEELEPDFTKKLKDLFEEHWPVKNNNVDLKTWLFGGSYYMWHDPCHNSVFEGFNTFNPANCPETFKNFDAFKNAIDFLIGEFGWNEETNHCDFLCEMNVDSNEYHHKYTMPEDKILREWYEKILKGNEE